MNKAQPFKAHSAKQYRNSAIQYAAGRAVNAVFGLGLFLVLARTLPAQDYATYVVVIAVLEILLMAGNLGMDWVTAIEIPKLQAQGAWHALSRFVAQALALQAGAFGVLAVILYVGAPLWTEWLDNAALTPLLQAYAAVLWLEGMSRAIRDQVLSSMLMQWASQVAQLLRNLALAVTLAVIWWQDKGFTAIDVARADIGASAGSLLLGMVLLVQRCRTERLSPSCDTGAHAGQTWRHRRQMAWHAWLASLTTLLWSGQIAVLLTARILGAEAAGVAGFARNIAEQLRKLMPLEFLFHQIRTYLVQTTTRETNPAALFDRIALFLRINGLLILPALWAAALYGDELSAWISGNRFGEIHGVLAGWVLWVIAWSHHRLSDTAAHLLKKSGSVGTISALFALTPLAYAAALQTSGLHGLTFVMVAAEVAYTTTVIRAPLRGLRYPWRMLGLPIAIAGTTAGIIFALALESAWPDAPLGAKLAVLCTGYFGLVGVCKPLRRKELALLLPLSHTALAGVNA